MPSPLKQVHTQTFTGGMNSDLAAELFESNQYRYMLNCNVLSSTGGNVGIVVNPLGNVLVSTPLPAGENHTIGVALDEESNYFYFAVWNSEGYHTWYRYSIVENLITVVLQSRTDSNDVDILNWPERKLILHANVIENNLLYWTMEGQAPRKIDIRKAMDKSAAGYGYTILEEYTRAYKRTGVFSPQVRYFTDTTKKFNRLYGYQFQFAYRFIYDNHEKSEFSDWSPIANPDIEYFTGTLGVPERNNGLYVTVETGSEIVLSIEIIVRRTNPEGGVLPWVSAVTLNKEFHNIASRTTYTYSFYNDGAYVTVDPKYPIRVNSALPRLPKCQEFTKNALMYANSVDGRDPVDIDVDWSVDYEEPFLPESTESELNNPEISWNLVTRGSQAAFASDAWRWVQGTFTVGPDVKAGNVFSVFGASSKGSKDYRGNAGRIERMEFTETAGLLDNSLTIATRLAAKMKQSGNFHPDFAAGGFVGPVQIDSLGYAYFDVRITNNADWSYWEITTNDGNPVNVITLKDNGQSVRIIKNGSSRKYGLVYADEDGRKEAVQSNDNLIVPIMTMNELNGIKKPRVTLTINHRPPLWAAYMSIVRTFDLVYLRWIDMLIQKVISVETSAGDQYDDLVVGSLFTYQRLHPNTILKYEFKKGDRLRIMYAYNTGDSSFDVVADAKDFEILDYKEVTEDDINFDIKVDGSSVAATLGASEDHIGSYLKVGNYERLIIDADDGVSYTLNSDFPPEEGTEYTYPSYQIINRRGVLRIKHDPDYPINDFDIVEVYTPASGNAEVNEDQFHEFSQTFSIINPGTDTAYHSGNIQDQTASQPAVIEITAGSAYIRNREFPVNNDDKNPQVLVAPIEDANYSDFYVSDLTDDGKLNYLDQGYGEILFDERIWWSNNYIEGTKINGLNDFDATNRVDYNDKYGAIQRLLFSEDRLYIFKYLKTAWSPVYGRRITTQDGQAQITTSPDILPNMPVYFLWDGGVGNNPESITRNGNNIYMVSPDSGIMARIGGGGVEPISKTYNLDQDARKLIVSAKKAGAFIISWFDRKNDNCEFSFESHDNVVYDAAFTAGSWNQSDGTPPPVGDRAYYGTNTTGVLPNLTTIESSASMVINGGPFTIPFPESNDIIYYWVAYPTGYEMMSKWQDPDEPLNGGVVGSPGGLFRPYQVVGSYRVTITRYPTQMGNIVFEN